MKRLVVAVMAAVLCACGGSSSSNNNNTGGNASSAGFVIAPTTCTVEGVTVSTAGVIVAIADRSFSDACGTASNLCSVSYKNLTSLQLAVVRFDDSGTVSAVAPGTYTVGTDLVNRQIVQASEVKTDATCQDVATPSVTGGTITLTSVGSTVQGSYNLTMSDATTRASSFSASSCGGGLPGGKTFCELITSSSTCTGTPTCQ